MGPKRPAYRLSGPHNPKDHLTHRTPPTTHPASPERSERHTKDRDVNDLVKLITDDDGVAIESPEWCLIYFGGGSVVTLCSRESFGYGDGPEDYLTKKTERGGITCNNCLAIIKEIKAVKL